MKYIFIMLALAPVILFAQKHDIVTGSVIHPTKQAKIITVGGTEADIPGYTNADIQMAFKALPSEGGIVKMNPGLYAISAPVVIPSNCKLIGSGSATILKRIDGFRLKLLSDADYGELRLTVEKASRYRIRSLPD